MEAKLNQVLRHESELLGFVIKAFVFFHNKTCDFYQCDSHFIKVSEGYVSSRTNRIFWPLLVHRMSNSKLPFSESANVELLSRSVANKQSFTMTSYPVHPGAKHLAWS